LCGDRRPDPGAGSGPDPTAGNHYGNTIGYQRAWQHAYRHSYQHCPADPYARSAHTDPGIDARSIPDGDHRTDGDGHANGDAE
jgi:hypothetical protein